MRRHLSNSAYGVLDYAAHPIVMLLVAPIVLRYLGVAQCGLWMVATAFVNSGAIIASGFCDANTSRYSASESPHTTHSSRWDMCVRMVWLLPRSGVHGLAMARLIYGSVTLLLYIPLVRILYRTNSAALPSARVYPVCEDA